MVSIGVCYSLNHWIFCHLVANPLHPYLSLFSPAGNALNDASAGTGTSTEDWINLVVGEGGVIDWISPGWRGEYKK